MKQRLKQTFEKLILGYRQRQLLILQIGIGRPLLMTSLQRQRQMKRT